jgi:hypothetical protein
LEKGPLGQLAGGLPYVDGVTPVQGARENRVQGKAAIRSFEMTNLSGMKGRDRKVFDNLGAVEVNSSPSDAEVMHGPH